MTLNIALHRSEDENGYATFRAAPYLRAGQQPSGANPLLRGIEIREWSSTSDGNLVHYHKRDKPVGRSVWRHSVSLTTFKSWDECKQDLLAKLTGYLKEIATSYN